MSKRIITALAMLAITPLAMAHGLGNHTHAAGLLTGLSHSFSGLDHLLAMLAVGLWAARQGGPARWMLPAAFVLLMATGAAVGADGIALPGMEAGILLSVLVLGMLLMFDSGMPLPYALTTIGLFAFFHGAAHGLEMPQAASPWAYGLGMLAATALLHAIGVFAADRMRDLALRMAGALISLLGIGMALSWI